MHHWDRNLGSNILHTCIAGLSLRGKPELVSYMYLPNSLSFVSSNNHSRIISTEVCMLVEDSVKLSLVVKITQAYIIIELNL